MTEDRIARVALHPVAIPFSHPEESATLRRVGFANVLVRVETEDGAVGWGEASGASGAPVEAVRATLEALAPLVVGQSVFSADALAARLIEASRMANLRRLFNLAVAAFDTACRDAAGRIVDRPLHALLGAAVRDEIDLYGYPPAGSPDETAERARDLVERGFSVVYLKAGLGERRDEATVAAVREAVGDEPRLRIDPNEAWDLATARRMSVRLARYGLDFVEQPIDARNLAGMRALRSSTGIPIAANQGIWTVADALEAIRQEACDVIVTGPLWLGGLRALQRVGALCAEAGIGFCLHAPPGTSIATAAGLHALATLPSLLDGNQTYLHLLADDVSDDLGPRSAPRLAVPAGPGLGIRIDEERVAACEERYLRDGDFVQNLRAVAAAR